MDQSDGIAPGSEGAAEGGEGATTRLKVGAPGWAPACEGQAVGQCNREMFRTGMLCGECQEGYSQTLGGVKCVPHAECGPAEWTMPVLGALAVVGYVIVMSSITPTAGVNAARIVSSAVYFYQVLGAVRLDGGTAAAATKFESFLKLSSATVFAEYSCPLAELTTLGSMKLALGRSLGVLLASLLTFIALRLWKRFERALRARRRGKRRMTDANDFDQLVRGTKYRTDWLSLCTKVVVKTLLLTYEHVGTATFKLLQCVDVDGKQLLFASAVHECGVWQVPYMALLGFLLSFSLVPLLIRLLETQDVYVMVIFEPYRNIERVRKIMAGQLCKPFRKGMWHWEALHALQRLLMTAAKVFVPGALLRMLVQVGLLSFAVTAVVLLEPCHSKLENRVEMLMQLALAIIAMTNLPDATIASLSTGGTVSAFNPVVGGRHPITSSIRSFQLVLTTVPFLVACAAVGWSVMKFWAAWRKPGLQERWVSGLSSSKLSSSEAPGATLAQRKRGDSGVELTPQSSGQLPAMGHAADGRDGLGEDEEAIGQWANNPGAPTVDGHGRED